MNFSSPPVSPYSADLSCHDLRRMIRIVRLLHQLSENTAYQRYLDSELPETARLDPGHHAVMMGYDFHLTGTGPKLIEVNTNAGGIWFANLCGDPEATEFSSKLANRLLETFYADYASYRDDPSARPDSILILDEKPEEQPLYSEMKVFAALFRKAGIEALIVDPAEIEAKEDRLYFSGRRIEMVYNRHCDFYLESPSLEHVRAAYLRGQLCLSPNPRAYGLLADKRRMMLWCQLPLMRGFGLREEALSLLAETIPETRLLADLSPEEAWSTRKQWVFKPGTGYASRGVYVGQKLTKHKLAELVSEDTLIQRWIPPSLTIGAEGEAFKTDYRLFVYKDRILGAAARIYQGQVTNLRTENGGFAKVKIIT